MRSEPGAFKRLCFMEILEVSGGVEHGKDGSHDRRPLGPGSTHFRVFEMLQRTESLLNVIINDQRWVSGTNGSLSLPVFMVLTFF